MDLNLFCISKNYELSILQGRVLAEHRDFSDLTSIYDQNFPQMHSFLTLFYPREKYCPLTIINTADNTVKHMHPSGTVESKSRS